MVWTQSPEEGEVREWVCVHHRCRFSPAYTKPVENAVSCYVIKYIQSQYELILYASNPPPPPLPPSPFPPKKTLPPIPQCKQKAHHFCYKPYGVKDYPEGCRGIGECKLTLTPPPYHYPQPTPRHKDSPPSPPFKYSPPFITLH